MKKITNKGFTLIELLVVVAIIAILALVVLLALNPVEMARRSRDSRRLSDMGTIRRAIDLSLADGKTLTTTTGTWINLNPGVAVTNMDGSGLDVSKYLSVLPLDPINDGTTNNTQTVNGGAPCTAGTTAKNAMNYQYQSDGSVYELRVKMESLDNCNAVWNDGKQDNYYEMGTNPGLTWN